MLFSVNDADMVFKALADRTRRELLDLIFAREGRTLQELEAHFTMSRFGVMKHLKILIHAHLIIVKRSGRHTLHYLNPIPIRVIHDRWIDKFTAPMAAGLLTLKRDLETTMEKMFEIYIKTTPELLWNAITDPELRRKYSFGLMVRSDWTVGSSYAGRGGGMLVIDGEILECDPPKRLVQSYRAHWSAAVKAEGTSRVTWSITKIEDSCRLTVVHDQLREGANAELYGGWPMILSGLKTLLETGGLLTTPGSLRYGA